MSDGGTGLRVAGVDGPLVETRTVHGTLLFPASDELMMPTLRDHGAWEHDLTTMLTATLRPGMRVLDVGANIGYFSLLASKLVGPEGSVLSVEPDPLNAALLEANMARNGCDNVTVLQAAAGAEPGEVTLLTYAVGGWEQGGGRGDRGGGHADRVPCVRLDDEVEGPLDVVKVDAEGFDHLVMQGLRRALDASPEVTAVVELWTRVPRMSGGLTRGRCSPATGRWASRCTCCCRTGASSLRAPRRSCPTSSGWRRWCCAARWHRGPAARRPGASCTTGRRTAWSGWRGAPNRVRAGALPPPRARAPVPGGRPGGPRSRRGRWG